ncbi:transposase [Streptomyces sp. NPDC058335]|uniref:transposase n=1 Tax=Streptomyces sp. NPDC058335 TaxID=3346451 RepID=UPI0036655E69
MRGVETGRRFATPGGPRSPVRAGPGLRKAPGAWEALPSPPWRGDSVGTPFRLGLEERRLPYALALHGKEVAHPEDVEPHQPAYGGLGPPTLPRYRTPPRAISTLAAEAGAERFSVVTWRQGSKGAMTSRFTVLTVRPAGTQSLAAAQESGGGRSRWDGVLPTQTSRSNGRTARTPRRTTGDRICRPPHRPLTWCGGRRCAGRSNMTTGSSNTAWDSTTTKAEPGSAGTTTSPSSPPRRHSSPSAGSTQKSRHRPKPLPNPRRTPRPAEVLDRHLQHLRSPPQNKQNQNLTEPY